MADERPNKNESFEALDFIINVLKEHEKDLDRLIKELGEVIDKFGQSGELSNKIEKIDDRLSSIQGEVAGIIKKLSSPKELSLQARGTPITVECKQWEDFKVMAKGADTVSFIFKEAEKSFQTGALKEGRVLTYNGVFPLNYKLLKFWLAGELAVPEESVFEGVLAIR